MLVIDFAGGEGDERAAVADVRSAGGLGFVEVAEGDVDRFGGKFGGGDGVFAPYEDRAFGAVTLPGAGDVEMAGEDEREAFPLGAGLADEVGVEMLNSGDEARGAVGGGDGGQARGGRIRDPEDMADGDAGGGENRNEVAFSEGSAVEAADVADDVDADSGQEITWGFEADGGIVVSGGDDDGHARAGLVEADEGAKEKRLCFGGGVRRVENVAGDDEGVGFRFGDQGY